MNPAFSCLFLAIMLVLLGMIVSLEVRVSKLQKQVKDHQEVIELLAKPYEVPERGRWH